MNFLYKLSLIIALTAIFISCKEDTEDPNPEITLTALEQSTLDLLKDEITPISNTPLSLTDAELRVLDRLGSKKMVGLGEATHGTREFFQMKHRIFQYLVENHGFKAFLFEMDLAETLIFDKWIQGDSDADLTELMQNKMIFWTWRTAEVEDLFRWMRSYNENKPAEDKIHLYGVDTQFTQYDLDALVARLEALDPTLADSVRIFNPLIKRISDLYPQKDQTDADDIERGILQTKALLEREKARLISVSSEEEFMWLERLTRHMEQVATYLYEFHFEDNFRLRDQYMAENSIWFSDLLGAESKVVLWAHNGHMGKNQFYGNAPSQGGHLQNALRSDYQVVGFGFTRGSFTAYGSGNLGIKRSEEDPLRNSYNFLFSRTETPAFIIDMTQIQSPDLRMWFLESKRFLSFGSTFQGSASRYYNVTPLTEHYDVLVYFDETLHSVLL